MYTISYYYKMTEFIIIDFVGLVIEAFLFIYLISNSFKTKSGISVPLYLQIGVAVLSGIFQSALGRITNNNFYIYCFLLLMTPLIYSLILFKGKFYIKLLVCLVYFLLIVYLDHFICLIIRCFSINGYIAYNIYTLLFILRRIIFKIVLYCITQLLIKKLFIINNKLNYVFSISLYMICITEFCILLNLWKLSIPLSFIIGLSCIFIPLFFYYFIYLIIIKNEENNIYKIQNCQLKLQQQYLEQLIGLSDSLKKFRHDYKNHLFCMDNLLVSGDYDALHKYLMDLHQMPFDNLTFYTYTSSKSVNIILNQKQNAAKAADIDFNLNIDLSENSNIKELDIVTLLSNLCDNAIEACTGLKDASINIIIKKVKAYLMIEVQNTVGNNILEKNPSLKTSKSDVKVHGFGTKIIKSIAEAYHGFYEVHCTDNLFTSKILLLEDIDYPEVNAQPVFTDKLRSYKPKKSEAV